MGAVVLSGVVHQEAVNECRGDSPTEAIGGELADVVLRTIDLAVWLGIDIQAEVLAKKKLNEERGTRVD